MTMGVPASPPESLCLFVPHPESSLCTQLARGSAIVGLPPSKGPFRVYYEGNLVGAANLARYGDRALQAASRLLHNYPFGYPTTARTDIDPLEVIQIGTIEPARGKLEITAKAEDLSWWIDPADLEELLAHPG